LKRTTIYTARDASPARTRGASHSSVEVISSLIGSDRLLDLVLKNTGDLIVILDRNGKRIYNSPSYRHVLGDPDALRGTSSFSEIHPEDRDQVQKLFQETVRSGRGKRAEFRFLLSDGSVKHIESRGHIIRDAKKEIRYVVVISRDITSHEHTRKQLVETETTLRKLVENSFVGVYIIQDGAFRYVNPRVCEILGRKARELTSGKKVIDTIVPEDRSRVAEQIGRHLAGQTPRLSFTYRALRKEGCPIDLELAGTRTVHEGKPAIIGTLVDITERKRAEAALLRSEQRFRSLVEAIPDWIWETDAAGRYTYASPKVKDLLGYEPAEVLGKRPRDFMHSADASEFGLQMTSFAPRGEPFSGIQKRHVTKDGGTVVLETSGVPVFGEDGYFRGYRGIDRDVTSRIQGEEERARLQMAVDQAAESILITEPDGRIVYVNPAFERSTGYGRNEMLGKTPGVLGSGRHDSAYFADLWKTITRGNVWSGHITNRRKDGTLCEEEMVISPVRDASGSVVNFVAVQRDMTNELEMERRLRQSQKMESLGQLAGGIAHDFNNVLGVIQGGLAILKSRLSDESQTRYIEISESAVNRGADVARRLLMFSRDGQVQLRPLSLADVADDLTRVLEHSIEKTIEIVTDIPPDLPIIQGDAGQLYQMLLNLCINARDAILQPGGERSSGRITLSARTISGEDVRKNFKEAADGTYVRVSVTDTGSGMTDEVRTRVFEPFFTTKPAGKGTGLGLAVAYGIVKSHLGFIDLQTSPGSGTTFHIYLVAYPDEKLAAPEQRNETVVGGTETILVVEDEAALRNLLTELLQSYGYTVLQAEDGLSGLDRFREHRGQIKAVITDMGLPRMSGEELFAKIRELDPSVRVILASGYLDPELQSHLFTMGAKAFLQKPYKPADILRAVRGVIDVAAQTERGVPT
jgi:two-component system, cell cycle sensor histidine kinase and response regulator CckA